MWSSHPGRTRDLSLPQMSRAALSPPILLFSGYRDLCPRRYSGWGMWLNTPQGENYPHTGCSLLCGVIFYYPFFS